MSQLVRGVVKWFNDAKGFGFIEHETGKDVFVHYSVIESSGFKTLKDGEEVEYELKEGDKGLHAARVVRVNPPETTKKIDKKGKSQPSLASSIEIEQDQKQDQTSEQFAPEMMVAEDDDIVDLQND